MRSSPAPPYCSGTVIPTYLRYLSGVIGDVQRAVRDGQTLEQTLASLPLDETFLPPQDSPLAEARPVIQGFHLWNVKKTYLEMNGK